MLDKEKRRHASRKAAAMKEASKSEN